MVNLKAQKANSMGYDLVDDGGNVHGYAKKAGYETYRLSINGKVVGKYGSLDLCIEAVERIEQSSCG